MLDTRSQDSQRMDTNLYRHTSIYRVFLLQIREPYTLVRAIIRQKSSAYRKFL